MSERNRKKLCICCKTNLLDAKNDKVIYCINCSRYIMTISNRNYNRGYNRAKKRWTSEIKKE